MTQQTSRLVVEVDATNAQVGAMQVVGALQRIEAAAAKAGAGILKMQATFNKASASASKMSKATQGVASSLSKTSTASTRASQSLRRTRTSLITVTKEAKRAGNSLSFLAATFKLMRNLYIAGRFIDGIKRLGDSLVDARLAGDRMKSTMMAVKGTAELAAIELKWLRETSDDMGTSFRDLATPYAKLAAAAKGTSLEGEKLRKIFVNITKATTTLHLGGDELKFTWMALTQMLSKSTVSMEELKRQLGERIPGVLKDAATAMGFYGKSGVDNLTKALKQGLVKTEDFLETFAELIGSRFEKGFKFARVALQAELMRMGNAWFGFKEKLTEGAAEESYIILINRIVAAFLNLEKKADELGTKLAKMIDKVTYAFELFFNTNYLAELLNTDGWERLYSKISASEGAISSFFEALSKGFNLIGFVLRTTPDLFILLGEQAGISLGYISKQTSIAMNQMTLYWEQFILWIQNAVAQMWNSIKQMFSEGFNTILNHISIAAQRTASAFKFIDDITPDVLMPFAGPAAASMDALSKATDIAASKVLEYTKTANDGYEKTKIALENQGKAIDARSEKNIANYDADMEASNKKFDANVIETEANIQGAKDLVKIQIDAAKAKRELSKAEGSDKDPFTNQGTESTLLGDGSKGGRGGGGGARSKGQSAMNQLLRERNALEKDYNAMLYDAKAALDPTFEATQKYSDAVIELNEATRAGIGTEEEHILILQNLQNEYYKSIRALSEYGVAIADSLSDAFGSLTEVAKEYAGEQSEIYRVMFAASKAFAIVSSVIKIQQAYAEALTLPPPLNYVKYAEIAALGATIISTIGSTNYSGGYDSGGKIPIGSVGMVGERGLEFVKGPATVTGRQDTAKLILTLIEEFRASKIIGGGNVRIINAIDPELFTDYIVSDKGEQVIMNVVRRNQATIQGLVI